jgi:anti-sigma regulatory factor (Ser/Thr protein kinase)
MGHLRQPTHQRFVVNDQADVGAARRAVRQLANGLDTGGDQSGRAELVVTELATNLLRHAEPGGAILIRPWPPGSIEVIAVDRGPGIHDLDAAVAGGTVTPNGLGCGLAAVRRASARFDIYSRPGRGTVVLSAVDRHGATGGSEPYCQPVAGVSVGLDEVCGDAWAVADMGHAVAIVVVDGVGHGVHAAAAADAALQAFALVPDSLDAFLVQAHNAMRGTRGGAVAVCRLERREGWLHYASVGNVSGQIVTAEKTRGLVSYNGTLGLQAKRPTVKVIRYPWPAGATLVLWTDGLSRRVDPDAEPGLLAHDPAVIAAALHRDYARDSDDATVVVAHHRIGT